MRIDLYTKIVLTGILGCLLWLCVGGMATPVQAQLGPTAVIVAGYQAGGAVRPMDAGLPVALVTSGATAMPQPPPSPSASVPAPVVAPLPSAPAHTDRAPTSMQCQAITKKGTQCSRMAKPGSRFCWQHGG